MCSRDQFYTEVAKQCRQPTRERGFGDHESRPGWSAILRRGGARHAGEHGQSKNDEQSGHVMSPSINRQGFSGKCRAKPEVRARVYRSVSFSSMRRLRR